MSYTLTNVLHHHGIMGEGDTLTDNAREAGIIYACLGCGSIGGIDPMTVAPTEVEAARQGTRDCIDWDAPESVCCPGSDRVLF